MPSIASLRGLRYDPKHVGALSQVIAPPYDVIDAALQARLYQQHPANVVRLELNREEPGDGELSNRYTRAAGFLKAWREQGALMQESAGPVPAGSVVKQSPSLAARSAAVATVGSMNSRCVGSTTSPGSLMPTSIIRTKFAGWSEGNAAPPFALA